MLDATCTTYRIAGNFPKSPTNTLRKNFTIFIFTTISCTMSDHTPYNLSLEMVTHSVYFQHRNDSKIFMLIKARRLLLVKNCHAKGRELRGSIHSCGELIIGHKKFSQFAWCFYVNFLIYSKVLCSTHQQEICGGKNFHRNKFLRAGVWSRIPRKFLPHKKFCAIR